MPSMMALRVLKRRLSNVIFARILADQTRREARVATGPGGHSGNDSVSSAVDSHLGIDSSEKPHPGPASTKPRTGLPAAS
jgi:transposase